jgi:TonB family protein
MEAFALYLLKSVIWLTGITVVYFLFLRNERFFILKRYYLLAGIVISFIFPLLTFHYNVEQSQASSVYEGLAPAQVNYLSTAAEAGLQDAKHFRPQYILVILYLTGIVFFLYRLLNHLRVLLGNIRKSKIKNQGHVRLIRTSELSGSFSFFNYVFINPSVNENELEIIMKHELVHVNQKHWFDLCLSELLCLFQWINPLAWGYTGLIRQNHEYIADGEALKRMSDHALYKAVLINRLFDSEVISLSDSFNYSLNKKRFEMMKNIVSSPYRKLKVFLVLPLFAIVFYAFAKPEYHYVNQPANSVYPEQQDLSYKVVDRQAGNSTENISPGQKKEVKGVVVQQDGKPLYGAAIIVKGTSMGTTSDVKGHFKLIDLPEDGSLVISFIGFRTKNVDYDFSSEMRIAMVNDTVNISDLKIVDKDNKEAHPLIVLDGIVTEKEIKDIDSWTISSINVLKDKAASDKYGEKGKNGVLEITTRQKEIQDKSNLTEIRTEKDLFIVVEEMPEFPGGRINLRLWLSQNIKYPAEAKDKKITGKVFVDFVVSSNGKVTGIKVNKPVHPLLDSEAIRVVSSMPDWKPGTQSGNPVDVSLRLPVEFNL